VGLAHAFEMDPEIENGFLYELAQERGYDVGFAPHTYAEHVMSYIATEIVKRGRI
jgi:hypothetical protein